MIDAVGLIGKRHHLPHFRGKLQQADLVLPAQQRMNKLPRRILLQRQIFVNAAAGVDRQHQVQRQLRLPLEDGDALRPAIFGHGKIVLGQPADNRPCGVGDVGEDIHQLHIHM
jgi:hypothetical protein